MTIIWTPITATFLPPWHWVVATFTQSNNYKPNKACTFITFPR